MMTAQEPIPTSPAGTHFGPEGLLYCDVCGGKRQIQLPLIPPRIVACSCACMTAQQNRLAQERKRQEEMDRISRNRSAATKDRRFLQETFAASEYDTRGLRIARRYADQWPQSLGLVFWGPPGTGKTYAANCIANALLDRDVPVLVTSLGKMLGALPAVHSGNQTAAIADWMRYPLLVLDDLGVERETPYAMEQVYNIIDARYRDGKPMIITTNLDMKQMEAQDSIPWQRIYRRILECCTPVKMDEINIRDCRTKENRSAAKNQLTDP